MSARIWVVDDDRAVRFVLATALREAGYEVEAFENAADVLERHQAITNPVRRNFGGRFREASPLFDGPIVQAAIFQDAAEIDVRRPEQRIEFQTCPQRMDRAHGIAGLVGGNSVVEIDEMQQRIGVVERDPGLVKLGRLRLSSRAAQDFSNLE